ncbi:hypothetical protein [Rhodovastum atsumiense]|uniref:Uncharacterized protein n=1 Tax=Rhodovastum atsumiense TaxID=504468 RepID=A0A5M6IMW5_9PROT|nr:hypothetical protein [Rhodovastum atsumiense]KAA5609604.1 hypothetical protein F1189_23555 [Rhodovastum atsumiense]
MSDAFRARLRAMVPAGGRPEPSAARVRISETFDDIAAARARGVTWQQIADLFTADGLAAADGTPLTAGKLNSLYAAEKAARGGRRKKRRPKTPAASPPVPAGADPVAPRPAPGPSPARFRFSGPVKLK